MKRLGWLLASFVAGCLVATHYTQWRVGAAQAREALYAVGAAQAYEELDRCQRPPRLGFRK